MPDTIAAIATGPAPGAIGIVRISGPDAFSVAERVFAGSGYSASAAKSHRIYYGHVHTPDAGEVLDEALLLTFRAPRSYTGEDVVEICCHGGPYVLAQVLAAALAAGARQAEPGEFTFRAYTNGRMDLAQAEAVASIIQAQSEAALRHALRQREGFLSRRVSELRQQLLDTSATIEAYIELEEDDLPPTLDQVRCSIGDLRASVAGLLRSARLGRIVREGFRIAIVGRPNVGKSTLLNALAGRDRAIVTPTAGTTRDVVSEIVTLGGFAVTVFDTAGIRAPRGSVECAGVEKTLATVAAADGILMVLDGSRGWTAADDRVMAATRDRLIALVWNKADLIGPALRQRRIAQATANAESGVPVLMISAATGEGIPALEQTIVRRVEAEGTCAENTVVVQERHAEALRRACDSMDAALACLAVGREPVLAAEQLREAACALGEIIGCTTTLDTVRRIFERFCVGK